MDNAINRYIYGDSKAHTKFKYLNNFAISVSLIILNYHKLCFISLYYNASTHSFSFCFVMCFFTLALFYLTSFRIIVTIIRFLRPVRPCVRASAFAFVCLLAHLPVYHHVCCSLAQSVPSSAHTGMHVW